MAGASVSASATQCVTYSGAVTLRGTLTRDTFPEQPNYESIANGDAAATYYFVVLNEPLCVEPSRNKQSTETGEEGVLRLQLAFGQQSDPYDRLRPYLGRQITCRGTLYHAISGHHHTPVLLSEPDCVTAEEFLRAVVESDLAGDNDPRVRRVTFSTQAAKDKHDKDAEADALPEAYFLQFDPLVVVRGWKMLPLERHGSKTCLTVDFDVVAKTVGRGLPSWMSSRTRRMQKVNLQQPERTRYCSVRVDGQWMLLDPPLPRVEQMAMKHFLEKELADAERRVNLRLSNDPRAIKNMRVISNSLADQLRALNQ